MEAMIWCPSCKEDRFELHRVPMGQEGHFSHDARPLNGQSKDNTKTCFVCDGNLTRKIG